MRKNSVRKAGSFLLMSAVWLSATSAMPLGLMAQTTATDTAKQEAQTDKDKKDKKSKKTDAKATTNQAQAKTQTQTPAATTGGKLAPNEDPAMIGKRNINGGSDKVFGWFGGSKEKEAAIGRQMAMEVEQQAKLIDDPVVTEYINRVGQNLVLHSDAKVPFTIKVIDTDEVNAFALPGGFFYVNRGLILAADNESELAGVMAHEIAHVAARHAMENQGKLTAINYGLLATILFGGGIASTIAQNAGGLSQTMAFLKFSRGAESEADGLAVQYLYASGYDPTGMATMFEKLASQNKKKAGTMARLFSTHPQPTNRRDASLALVSRFPEREEYVISTSEFQRVKSRLMKLTNAKSATVIDIDESTPGRPTLKRRAPEGDDSGSSSSTGSSSSGSSSSTGSSSSSTPDTTTSKPSGPPQLKRRGEDPAPTPSPTPNN